MNDKNTDFLRTEYSNISSYFINVINFRFIVFGFYLTIMGFLISSEINRGKAWIILIFTFIFLFLEIRNRGLSGTLLERGKDIENEFEEGKKNNDLHYFNLLDTKRERNAGRFLGFQIPSIPLYEVEKKRQKMNFFPKLEECKNDSYIYFFMSHSFVMDISYILGIIYSLIIIIKPD